MKILFFFFLIFISLKTNAQMFTSLYFEHNRSELNAESKTKLDSLAQLKTNLRFRIFGNCDSSGTSEYNQKLSEKRAKTVSDYLQKRIGKNIKLGNSVGLGERKQINDGSTDELMSKNRRVDIFIEKKITENEKIERKEFSNFLNSKISQIKKGDTLSLPNVNFYGGRHVWLPNAESSLVRLVKIMKENPTLEIELQGHICCDYENFDGEDIDLGTFNLSVTRAKSIKDYLILEEIKPSRIKIKGLGHLNPFVYPEVTETDRTKNRRVEVMVVRK